MGFDDVDLEGNDRLFDDLNVDNTGFGSSLYLDIGAYEAAYEEVVTCTLAEAVTAEAGAVLKNRYLSFNTNNNGDQVAIRVTLVSTGLGSAYQEFVGRSWWVQAYDSNDVAGVHRLGCLAVYQDWQALVIYVADGVIFPESTYDIEVVNQDCCPGNPSSSCAPPGDVYSTPYVAQNSLHWGDIVGRWEAQEENEGTGCNCWTAPNGIVDQEDIDAVLEALALASTEPPQTWADVSDSIPDTDVGISDLIAISNAAPPLEASFRTYRWIPVLPVLTEQLNSTWDFDIERNTSSGV